MGTESLTGGEMVGATGEQCFWRKVNGHVLEHWPRYGFVAPTLITTNGNLDKLLSAVQDDMMAEEIRQWAKLVVEQGV